MIIGPQHHADARAQGLFSLNRLWAHSETTTASRPWDASETNIGAGVEEEIPQERADTAHDKRAQRSSRMAAVQMTMSFR